jgi:hypothetical protein
MNTMQGIMKYFDKVKGSWAMSKMLASAKDDRSGIGISFKSRISK